VDKFVGELAVQLTDRGVTLEVSPEARAWLSKNGYSPQFGARPMARLIQQELKKALADELLFGTLQGGGTAVVTIKDDKIHIVSAAKTA
jgi:ATP-dependent Clp protease ATP-binding subunit ClpA